MIGVHSIGEKRGNSLPNNSNEAMVCSFECTFCQKCVSTVLEDVCPNCRGTFKKRHIRHIKHLEKHPVNNIPYHKPVDKTALFRIRNGMKHIPKKDH